MIRRMLVVTTLLSLAGCASATLPYTPEQQPSGARVSAAYQLVGDNLKIEIDTDGRRLEEAAIVRADGTAVRPQAIENPPTVVGGSPVDVGIGVGGGRWGGRGGIGVGTGVSVGIPVGRGSRSMEGNTFAWFPLDQAGPPPWRLHLKLVGTEPTVILVGGADSG